jgi:hypothetical protein
MAEAAGQGQFVINPTELWKRVVTKGDLATVLIAGPIGFVGDIALSLTGLVSPGTCALLAASGALGIKNGIQAARSNGLSKSSAKEIGTSSAGAQPPPLIEKARTMQNNLDALKASAASGPNAEATKSLDREIFVLGAELNLFEKGVSTEIALDAAIQRALNFYRQRIGLDTIAPVRFI